MNSIKQKNNIYITTTLPYVNASPHVGFAMEIIRADVMARYYASIGKDIFFNTGTDEHGQKIYEKAITSGKTPKEYVDIYAKEFKDLSKILNLINSLHFIRTTDEKHISACQEIWKRCDINGYIYKSTYRVKYCVGCELEKNDSDLVNGRCPEHPMVDIQFINEENYFFKFSAFQEKLLSIYTKENFIIPEFRKREVTSFVQSGLKDFSISRMKTKMPWGVPVPNDNDHVMYVWFDALTNYISTLDWPNDKNGNFKKFWEDGYKIQFAGKDNLRQQSAMWQAILLAADLPNTDTIVIDGFITGEGGTKMSKSIGNVINPYDLYKKYGTDALRYYLLRHVNSFDDSPMSLRSFDEAYHANLVNGIGNLLSRVLKLSETHGITLKDENKKYLDGISELIESFDIQKAIDIIWKEINNLDEYISKEEPYKVIKIDMEKGAGLIRFLLLRLYMIANSLVCFMPETSKKIIEALDRNKKPEVGLFPRINI